MHPATANLTDEDFREIDWAEYCEDQNANHTAWFSQIARDIGLVVPSDLLDKARSSTDPHFNDVRGFRNDDRFHQYGHAIADAMVARGKENRGLALSYLTCCAKAAARETIYRENQQKD